MGEERIKENLNIILNRFHKHDEGWQAKVLEEITAANVALFRSQNNDDDATDGILTLREIVESIWKNFQELVGISNYKKNLCKSTSKNIYVTFVDTIDKI